MASGYAKGGTDLDSIFAAWHTGWPQAAATDFDVVDTDLSARYAPLSTGTAAAATIYKIASGADLNTIFAAYGSTGVIVEMQPAAVSGSAAAGNPNGTVTSDTTSCLGERGSGTYSYTWHVASGSGVTFTEPSQRTTAVTGTVSSASTISGTMYCTISDGVTSIDTNTVAWSLQNTTPAVSVIPYTVDGRAVKPDGRVREHPLLLEWCRGIRKQRDSERRPDRLLGPGRRRRELRHRGDARFRNLAFGLGAQYLDLAGDDFAGQLVRHQQFGTWQHGELRA